MVIQALHLLEGRRGEGDRCGAMLGGAGMLWETALIRCFALPWVNREVGSVGGGDEVHHISASSSVGQLMKSIKRTHL